MKKWLAVFALLASIVPAALAAQPPASPTGGAEKEIDFVKLFSLPEAIPAACPGSFCNDDLDCACSSASSATCGPSGTCVYTYPGTNPGGGGQSGALCLPGRFCLTVGLPCGSCTGGGQGVCAADRTCRIP